MIILPAIDIKDGNCVRLFKGDYATVEKVCDTPYKAAEQFKAAGAQYMHMVDLDGGGTSYDGRRRSTCRTAPCPSIFRSARHTGPAPGRACNNLMPCDYPLTGTGAQARRPE